MPNGRSFPPTSNEMSGTQSGLGFDLQPVSGTTSILDSRIGIAGQLRPGRAAVDAHLTNTKETCPNIVLTAS